MSMKEGESVKPYVERYWEMFNEIDGDFDEVAIKLSRSISHLIMV